jgi:hypothetical protein
MMVANCVYTGILVFREQKMCLVAMKYTIIRVYMHELNLAM